MTAPFKPPITPRLSRVVGLGIATLTGLALAHGCATADPIEYGTRDCVAAGCPHLPLVPGQTGTGGGGGAGGSVACSPDAGCAVTFQADIFEGIIKGSGNCAEATLCHGSASAPGGLALDATNAQGSYAALAAASLTTGGKYIVPCDPGKSKFLCNMRVSGGTNPHAACGNLMPLSGGITPAQLTKISDWITCGAPDN